MANQEMSQSASVSLEELVDAYGVSVGQYSGHAGYICRETGRIYLVSSDVEIDDDVPEDIEESDQYIGVPSKYDLNLGQRLVFSFVERELPRDYDRVRGIFSRKGAYRRFKDLLDVRESLDKWYAFEAEQTERALRDWCEGNDIPIRA